MITTCFSHKVRDLNRQIQSYSMDFNFYEVRCTITELNSQIIENIQLNPGLFDFMQTRLA